MKAMMGSGVDARTLQLLDEIRVLRARVAELEDALETATAVEHADETDVRLDVAPVLESVLEGAAGR